jgi:hypothetical protein
VLGKSIYIFDTNRHMVEPIKTNQTSLTFTGSIYEGIVRKAFDELGFVVAGIGEIELLAANRSSGVIVSQASEDLFNASKNHRLVKGKKRFRRPEKQYASMLAKGVPERVHRFTPIKPDTRADKSAALSQDAFVAKEDKCSVPVGDIVSSKPTPDFTTCGVENLCRSIVDLQVMRDLELGAGFHRFDACWLGGLCIWEHNLVLRKIGFPDSWVLPLNSSLVLSSFTMCRNEASGSSIYFQSRIWMTGSLCRLSGDRQLGSSPLFQTPIACYLLLCGGSPAIL